MNQRDRRETRGTMSYFRNGWRRKMGKQQNELMFEDFGFVNMQACQKMLHGSGASSLYKINKREEFLCYNSERRYITEDDAGAPALRKGRLVAVTVGGVDFEGEHVAVGMKMICFCSWIAENLPKKNGPELQCCKNCCDSSTEETETKKSKKHTRKKKKL
ncbi:uncharacterized protein LOC112046243 [Bicyclus anynana]|uniref:Uncharacterized protein LOC112046243 n=1 Tax=Bicyclus anynana TaxID=110368 RepID=A0A6J1N097_BICAN|nr:uncharacterized protein LOC112046243 [Bicyclus anynana]